MVVATNDSSTSCELLVSSCLSLFFGSWTDERPGFVLISRQLGHIGLHEFGRSGLALTKVSIVDKID